jgi:hypothetical protein
MQAAHGSVSFVALVLSVALTGTTGCRGWARGQIGGAFNVADRPRQSGTVVAVDAALGIPATKWINGGRPLPFGLHTSLDLVNAPERKAIGWGTGVVFYSSPRPISGYVIGGTSLHFDQIRDRFSFGNVSPYVELGVIASVPARVKDEGDGLFLSLGLAGATYFNYLVGGSETVDAFGLLKLGIGWERY